LTFYQNPFEGFTLGAPPKVFVESSSDITDGNRPLSLNDSTSGREEVLRKTVYVNKTFPRHVRKGVSF
jgi:hypothetical protein